MEFKIDLHVHSVFSYDGGNTAGDLENALERGILHCIAVTDHNEVSFAQRLQRDLGERILVGEEILSREGIEVIGLCLWEKVRPGLPLEEVFARVRDQQGLLYVPHPLDTYRHGIGLKLLEEYRDRVDIIEFYNARSVNNGKPVRRQEGRAVYAAGSDSHSRFGLGRTYNRLKAMPTRETLVELLGEAQYVTRHAGIRESLSPSVNKIRKRLGG